MTTPTVPGEPANRNAYTDEFRRAAVDPVGSKRLTVAEAARRLGVHPVVVRKCKRRYAPAAAPGAAAGPAAPDPPRPTWLPRTAASANRFGCSPWTGTF